MFFEYIAMKRAFLTLPLFCIALFFTACKDPIIYDPIHATFESGKGFPEQLFCSARSIKINENEYNVWLELRNLKVSDIKQLTFLNDPSRELVLTEKEKGSVFTTTVSWTAHKDEWRWRFLWLQPRPRPKLELTMQDGSQSLITLRRNGYHKDIFFLATFFL